MHISQLIKIILFCSLLFTLGKGKVNKIVHPKIQIIWKGKVANNRIPVMKVFFIREKKLREVHLSRRSPFGKISISGDLCSFEGTLKGIQNSRVTVSGCPKEEYQVAIHLKGQESIFASVTDGTTFSTTVIQRSSKDVIVQNVNDTDYLENGAGFGTRDLPNKLYIRLGVAIDETFKDYFSNDISKSIKVINQIMLHVEGLFHDESLGSDISFQEMSLYDHSEVSSIGSASEEHLSTLAPYAEEYNKEAYFNHFVLFSYDPSGDDVVGMSYIGKICSEEAGSRISIAEYDQSPIHTALIFAHELGHNLGLAHDAGVCVGIMYPLIIGAKSWSSCSKLQLKAYYNKILNKVPFFCLEEGSGNWNSWEEWSACGSDCEQKRKRVCTKNICSGNSTESRTCCSGNENSNDYDDDEDYNKLAIKETDIQPISITKPKENSKAQALSRPKNVNSRNTNHLISLLFGNNLSKDVVKKLLTKFNPWRG